MSVFVLCCIGASALLYLFNSIVSVFVNIRHSSTMKDGGKKVIYLSVTMMLLNFLMGCMCVIVFIFNLKGSIITDGITAMVLLISGMLSLLYLRFRKSLNMGLELYQNQSEYIKKTRNVILSNISHEIRTPMNTIIGLTEVLKKDEQVPDTMQEKLDNMSQAAANLLGVVNNLIDFAKIESNKLDIIECDYNLKDVIQDVISKSTDLLADKSVEFLADVDANMPSVLHGDDVRITQAITNVINNACKYTHVGVITFRVGFKPVDRNRGIFHFDVEDTGIGISEDDKPYVFMPNNGEAANVDRTNKGAGLSMLITRSIIDKMGGYISFSSEPGVGTNFYIEIPQTIVSSDPIGSLDDETMMNAGERYMFTAPMAKVLVVDDNIVNLFVAKEILANYGMEIQTASSGPECIDLVNENYYDLIFMDYVMPGMDGHETLLKLRQPESEYFRRIPVIALTAQTTGGSERIYLDEGFQGFLSKPIDVHDLEKILLKFLPEEYVCMKEGIEPKIRQQQMDEKLWYKRLCSVLVDFDVKLGLEHCNNDYTSYLNLLRVIYNDSFQQSSKLREFVRSGDIDSYRISVHALKSVTASAGDMRLSFICEENENAAKNNDLTYIRNHVETLISEYESFLTQIDTILQRESEMMSKGLTSHKQDRSAEEIKDLVDKLIASLDDYNVDDASNVLIELEHTNLTYDQEKALAEVQDELSMFKYELAIESVKKAFEVPDENK